MENGKTILESFINMVELRADEIKEYNIFEELMSCICSFRTIQMLPCGLELFNQFTKENGIDPVFAKYEFGGDVVRKLSANYKNVEIMVFDNCEPTELSKYDYMIGTEE